jgi:hypothetical protein
MKPCGTIAEGSRTTSLEEDHRREGRQMYSHRDVM